jgi:hypothetical protein
MGSVPSMHIGSVCEKAANRFGASKTVKRLAAQMQRGFAQVVGDICMEKRGVLLLLWMKT